MDNKQKEPQKFIINKAWFENEFSQCGDIPFTPTKCLLFSMPLPFQLPVKDGTIFSALCNQNATVFAFNKYEVKTPMPYTMDKGSERTFLKTRVEFGIIVSKDSKVNDVLKISELKRELFHSVYEHCVHLINRLNNILYSYRMLVEDSKVYSVNLEQSFLIHLSVINLPDWNIIDQGPFIVNRNPSNYEDIIFNLSEEATLAVRNLGFEISFNPGKFTSAIQFFADARRHLHRGEYRETLIYLGLCSEAYLNGIYYHILAVDGKSENEIADAFDSTPFMSRIKKTLSQRVGGDWSLDNELSVVSSWNINVYKIRGRVVHGGYFPNAKEAWSAFKAVSELDKFLRENLRKKKSAMPQAILELELLPELFVVGKEEVPNFDVS